MEVTLPSGGARVLEVGLRKILPLLLGAVAFLILFERPITTLARDWWSDPEAGHGLLLGPLAFWLAWKRGLIEDRHPWPWLGLGLLLAAVALRYASGLAAELYTMRLSLLGALVALTVFAYGIRQVIHWWLPLGLLLLSIPLPDVVLSTLAFPLQLEASRFGAALLEWRQVPVVLAGNVIQLPGQSLFVTEACSGLRSLTALLALGLLMGGLWLRQPWTRLFLLAAAIPVAMFVNGIRVFLTGFLVFFVDPALGEGFMHYTEGWVLFVFAFLILGGLTWTIARAEDLSLRRSRVVS